MVIDRTPAEQAHKRHGTPVKLVAAPVASPGVRHALRQAFACEQNSTEIFDRLLAKLR